MHINELFNSLSRVFWINSPVYLYIIGSLLCFSQVTFASQLAQSAIHENSFMLSYHIKMTGLTQAYQIDVCKLQSQNQSSIQLTNWKLSKSYIELISSAWDKNSSINQPCLTYQFSPKKSLRLRNPSITRLFNDSVVTSTDEWLLIPTGMSDEGLVKITFDIPSSWKLSTPWAQHPTLVNTFYTPMENFSWPTQIAFGKLNIVASHHKDLTVAIALVDDFTQQQIKRLSHWIDASFDAFYKIHQKIPTTFSQVLIMPTPHAKEPVPFAQVLRGGNSGLHFYVGKQFSQQAYIVDWTSYHEIAHLLFPFIDREFAWISEGLASYYQYLLMGSAKVLTEEQTWQKLADGFARGHKSTMKSQHLTLNEVTPNMFTHSAVRRVYWSGAIAFFELDLALQKKDIRLVDVLFQFTTQFLPSYQVWTADQVAQKLDILSDSSLFTSTFRRYSQQKAFPNYVDLLKNVGVTINSSGRVELEEQGAKAQLRKKILNVAE